MGQTNNKHESATEKTVLENNMVLNNEVKTTNNDLEFLMLVLVVIAVIGFIIFTLKQVYKMAKNATIRDQIILRHARN